MNEERLKELYSRGGCTVEQIQRYVALGAITEAQRDAILKEVNHAEHE